MFAAMRRLREERDWIQAQGDASTRGEPAIEDSESPEDLAYAQRRAKWGFVVVNGVMAMTATGSALAQLLTLGHARRFCLNVVAPFTSRTAMRLLSIDVRFHGFDDLPSPCIVTANHTSTLDLFIISMFPVRNKRHFMARWTQLYPPLAVISWTTGTILTAPQRNRDERVKIFQDAERVLRETGDSVYLSPEGKRRTDGVVNPFNRGTFHLATNLGWPIVPVYVSIPRRVNPGVGFATRPGVVDVYAGEPVDTSSWTLDDVDANKDRLHDYYAGFPEGWGVQA